MGGQGTIEHLLGGLSHADSTLGSPRDTAHARRRQPESAASGTESAPAWRGSSAAHTGTTTPTSRGAGSGR